MKFINILFILIFYSSCATSYSTSSGGSSVRFPIDVSYSPALTSYIKIDNESAKTESIFEGNSVKYRLGVNYATVSLLYTRADSTIKNLNIDTDIQTGTSNKTGFTLITDYYDWMYFGLSLISFDLDTEVEGRPTKSESFEGDYTSLIIGHRFFKFYDFDFFAEFNYSFSGKIKEKTLDIEQNYQENEFYLGLRYIW